MIEFSFSLKAVRRVCVLSEIGVFIISFEIRLYSFFNHLLPKINSSRDSCISLSVDGVNVTSAASKNVLIKYTSYDTKVLPSRSVFAGTTKFGFTKNSVKIKVTEITFVYNDLSYTLQPNEDITFTID